VGSLGGEVTVREDDGEKERPAREETDSIHSTRQSGLCFGEKDRSDLEGADWSPLNVGKVQMKAPPEGGETPVDGGERLRLMRGRQENDYSVDGKRERTKEGCNCPFHDPTVIISSPHSFLEQTSSRGDSERFYSGNSEKGNKGGVPFRRGD